MNDENAGFKIESCILLIFWNNLLENSKDK